MRGFGRPAVAGFVACMLGGFAIVGVAIGTTTDRTIEHLTLDWPAQDVVQGARISTDGNVVAFSAEPNIAAAAPGSTGLHVFIRDRATSAVEQISLDSNETGGQNSAFPGGLSADGRYVTFTGYRLDAFGAGEQFVYVRDRQAGTTEPISVADDGGLPEPSGSPGAVDISDDGRFVAFTASSGNLLPLGEDTNGEFDTFLRDRVLGTTIRISVGPGGIEGDGDSYGVAISGDGSTVVFDSRATNLLGIGNDTNGSGDTFAYDVATGAVERISVADDEAEAAMGAIGGGLAVSADGSIIAFSSPSMDLVTPVLSNPLGDVFVRDRAAGTTVRASVNDSGTRPNVSDVAYSPSLSADGTRVAFASRAPLDPDDWSSWSDVYLRDLSAGTTELITRGITGTAANNVSGDIINVPSIEIDGSGNRIAFISYADDLTTDPSDDSFPDVYVSYPTPADSDGDGISDDIDTGGTTFSDGTTFGSVVSIPAGFAISITDAVGVDEGVRIVITGTGTQKVRFLACGAFTVYLAAGTDGVFTCGSIVVDVAPGSPPVEVVLGDGLAVVTVPAGVQAEIDQAPNGSFTVDNVSGGTVSVTVDGQTTTVAGPGPFMGQAWDFDGFKAPVDNGGVPNIAKAGRTVPIKWHLASASGAAITDLATAKLTVVSAGCSTSTTADQIEDYATGSSGLINQGNGNYQLNWQTPAGYANSCKTLRLDIGDGVYHTALFKFTK